VSELIPTTADVRDAFSSESSDSTYANRMFDLWLAKYKAKTIAKEQDRIIEIIERCPRADNNYMILCDARHLIELIKGENK
jgi:hypothetical protein